ncbi:tetratricopeptide repeat protein [Paenibacillus antri]|uniref:Tetratricopeptide repeat protein n=1 Tax=Paenibacillus antri TaxID=2582848 RepID=A0A5R9GEA5_9BACL|nr:LuxR C-terminal-related transcriptional regulator [Paenibacillus antri]TLS50983.1 tetratricopeptide repeat protein [Paenibacillus antri]
MNMPILATKLYIPLPRTNVVLRKRLLDRLNEGLNRKLTLISASAGFGKTTLVGEWAAGCDRPVAWLSLDAGDNDVTRFFSHLVAALQTVEERMGEGAAHALRTPQPPSYESLMTMLLNDIAAFPRRLALVLDDYHATDDHRIDNALAFLLEHLPPQLHLVIATREDPRLPLSRLRARGQLNELRAADLRFTSEEAAAFLDEGMGLALSAGDIAALETRTEGWITGLQLAALSMRGREDVSAFIRAFAGDNRYIVDYLVEEVLQRQPAPIRRFLLQTSILDRLHGPLCDAVTGMEGSGARLEALERGNFFVVPLDDRRRWYRYHHLFAEVLAAHLASDPPERIATLHRRASAWHERHGSSADAIRHALAAEDFGRAADMVERAWPALRAARQEAAALGWLKALPDELIRRRPVLCVEYAWALLSCGEAAAAEDRLSDAERWLEPAEDGRERPEVVDEAEFARLPAAIALYRAALAQGLGDVPAVIRYARRVLELVPEDDDLPRGAATALLGLASWTSGDLETAYRMFEGGLERVQRAGNVSDAVGGAIALADIRIAQGRLREALRIYERGLQLASEQGGLELRGTADLYVGMSELCRERNDLHAAERHLASSVQSGERAGFPQNRYRRNVAMARIREAQGDPDGALDLLQEADRLYAGDFFPNARPVAALKARLRAGQGRVDEALDWAREQGLSVEDDLSYLREFEHLTLVRVLLARFKSDRSGSDPAMLEAAIGLLERLLQAAEEGGRTGSAIEILVVQALARQMQGDVPAALAALARALSLAEPEGYVRVFADEGRPMAALLEAAAKQGIARSYVRRLLSAFGQEEDRRRTSPGGASEPLSEREREVLRLLRTEWSGPDIARELGVSLNTLRTHTKHIYEKLEVNNRRAAVRRAEELGDF